LALQEDKFNITTKIFERIEPSKLIKTLCIQGMPGVANTGKGALDFIAKQSKAKKIMEIYFSDFPSQVKVNPDGCLDASKVELLYYRDELLKRDIILLTSDTQPTSNIGMNVLSKFIAKTLKSLGVTLVISLAAKPLTFIKRNPRVFVTATSKELVDSFSRLENVSVLKEGIVIGMNGMVPVVSKSLYDIEGVILLSESCKTLNHDVAASYALIKVLTSEPGLSIDVSSLEKERKAQWDAGVSIKRARHGDERKPDYIS